MIGDGGTRTPAQVLAGTTVYKFSCPLPASVHFRSADEPDRISTPGYTFLRIEGDVDSNPRNRADDCKRDHELLLMSFLPTRASQNTPGLRISKLAVIVFELAVHQNIIHALDRKSVV